MEGFSLTGAIRMIDGFCRSFMIMYKMSSFISHYDSPLQLVKEVTMDVITTTQVSPHMNSPGKNCRGIPYFESPHRRSY
jgi:hypothetical protein